MYNFSNLSDVEFEVLSKDIMQKKLGIELYTFAKGRDGGIDITEDPIAKKIVVQIKHYINSTYANLRSSLKKEVQKVKVLKPEKYYICCALKLTAENKREIYNLFSEYMENANNVIALQDINDFLENPDNIDIVRKHYKLWLESTNILCEVFNQSIFVDCESLLYNIDECSKKFVATNCYYECLDILEQERMLLLLGMPGTGKTITTKMLALYYASKGYRIRYTTNGDIKDVKNALSSDKDLLEIVLLDDCLGQHYFRMKETQENELLSLVKYVAMNKNKKLIMNSRVAIFQQAKEQSIEFKQFVEDKKFKIKILDLGKVSIEDKGKIFYNHIYFKRLPKEYYQDILKNRNYRKIVMHNNYTPRIMEYVTRAVNYNNVRAEEYSEYILKCLSNPTEIWKDEFFNKLQQEDRVFMTTLYSLTDTSIKEDRLKRAFNYRLCNTMEMDTTRNIWEEVLRRLEGALIIIVDKFQYKEIGVINPSVNDFLKEYLQDNEMEKEIIKRNATEYEQIKRGFSESIENIMQNGEAILYNYSSENEKQYVILTYVCRLGILNESYKYIVEQFYDDLSYGSFSGLMNRSELFIEFLTDKFAEFYNTYALIDEKNISYLLSTMDIYEFQDIITLSDKYGIGVLYEVPYKEEFINALNKAILEYIDDIDIYDYYESYDINELLKENMEFNGFCEEVDEETVGDIISEWIREDVVDEVRSRIEKLPENILREIKIFKEDINVKRNDVESFIQGYTRPEPDYGWEDFGESHISGNIDSLAYIFK